MSFRARCLTALVLLQVGSVAARAQEPNPEASRMPRSALYAGLGALFGIGISALYAFTEDENTSPGECTSAKCVLAVAGIGGSLVGYMIGREMDQLHTLRYRGGAPLYPRAEAVGLSGDAFVLAVRDTLIAVGGRNGVQLVSSGTTLKLAEKRASGIRGITALDIIPGFGSIALGSPSGFYLYPPRTGPGMQLREGETQAVTASPERIYFATGTRIEAAPVAADTLRSWPGIEVGSKAIALAYDETRAILWAVTDTTLIGLRPDGDSLAAISRTRLPGKPRMVTSSSDRVAVAMGEGGLVLYDATDASAPRERGRWSGTRFVYSVSIAGERLFAAAGLDGVYVLNVTPNAVQTFGLARELGFATLLVSRGEHTFLVDRTTNSLRRISSTF